MTLTVRPGPRLLERRLWSSSKVLDVDGVDVVAPFGEFRGEVVWQVVVEA